MQLIIYGAGFCISDLFWCMEIESEPFDIEDLCHGIPVHIEMNEDSRKNG